MKIYVDKETGRKKGDALVTYLKVTLSLIVLPGTYSCECDTGFTLYVCVYQEPSVALAIQILDGTPFRPGGTTPMSVTQAKFEQKGNCYLIFIP